MVVAAKRRFGEGWTSFGPGGMRDGRMLRFAEADTDSASAFRLLCFHTAEPGKGLAVFNRSAHSAGPGNWELGMGEGQWTMGSWHLYMGNQHMAAGKTRIKIRDER